MAWKRSSVRIRYSPQILRWRIFCMTFFVYILYAKTANKYYVGETENINSRLQSHLAGISKYTSIAKDWIVVHTESFNSRGAAIKREREIKRKKSQKYIESIIEVIPASRSKVQAGVRIRYSPLIPDRSEWFHIIAFRNTRNKFLPQRRRGRRRKCKENLASGLHVSAVKISPELFLKFLVAQQDINDLLQTNERGLTFHDIVKGFMVHAIDRHFNLILGGQHHDRNILINRLDFL